MKINDYILRYSSNSLIRDGICRIRTFVNSNLNVIILITDLDTKNTSASVTNSIEIIYQTLIEKYNISKTSIFIEHYEAPTLSGHTFDIISINAKNNTEWKPITLSQVLKLIESDENEINNLTFKNPQLLTKIEQLRTIISPHLGLPYQVQPEYILRQFEIENNMISKNELRELIDNHSIESKFLELLKKDKSFFAEIYASPNDSYICFSEFPVGEGTVDFVLFTGRSRMDVFLIEIKGADFNLLTQGYKKFNHKLDIAINQIRDRLDYIYRNISSFRESVHEYRERVSNGERLFNSLMGPCQDILVDKNKDINIHSVVIGGRTKDDLEESYKRHSFESTFNLPIKLESWDSFYRKLRRR
ncbi:Shedu immune nuclease family protein [Capnocytophaga canimorsus]|uniref:Shedu immune nuclease family protein n=1 Tax=Capnocytophaga canimorsus TaxID=28188 RepID=UPI0037D88574